MKTKRTAPRIGGQDLPHIEIRSWERKEGPEDINQQRAPYFIYEIYFYMYGPCCLSAIVKAGSRSGRTHRKIIPIVVTDLPVMFTEPVMYEDNDLRSPVHVALPSVMMNLFFLPIVRTPQDFASHKG